MGPREGKGEGATSDFVPLCLGIPEYAGVTKHFRPLLGPREGKGEAATSDFVPLCWVTHFASHFLSFFLLPRFVVWPLELGLGTHNPRFVAWPLELGFGTHNPRFVAWPLELKHLVLDVLQADALNRSSWCDCGNGGCPRCNLAFTIVLIKRSASVSASAERNLPLLEERGVHIMQLWCKKEVQYAIDCATCPQPDEALRDLLGRLKRSARAVQLFGCLAVLETHALRS